MKKILGLIILVALVFSVLAVPASAAGPNLIVNGDFEAGNTGFTTEYTYLDPANTGTWTLGPEYLYTVSTDPHLYHSAWTPFPAHGGSNMMIVNGTWDSYTPDYNAVVWAQQVELPECDPVSTYPMYAGQTILVGDVLVKSDENQICVKLVLNADAIEAGWLITEAHVAIADDDSGIPATKNGNPIPGKFTVNENLDPGLTETEWYCLDIGVGWTAPYAVAAHAVVEIAEISHTEDTSFCIVSDENTFCKTYGSSDPLVASTPAWVHPSWTSQYGTTTPFGATWIWNSYRTLQPVLGEVVEFQREFVVDGTPTAATLQITADNGYEAYMNGTPIGSAQVSGDWKTSNLTQSFVDKDNWQTPETWDITTVGPGSNNLLIYGANEYRGPLDGQANGTIDSNPGAIAYNLCVEATKTVIDRPYQEETAWGGTTDFPGRNWANYIEYTPKVCSTEYLLEFWAGNSYPGSEQYPAEPAILEVQINGEVVGTLSLEYTYPTAPTPGWMQFSTTWDAGSATSASIEIRDTRHIMYGDDFVIDDISFAKQ